MLIKGVKSLRKKKFFFCCEFCLFSRILLVFVLLSALVKRCFVSCMRNFFLTLFVNMLLTSIRLTQSCPTIMSLWMPLHISSSPLFFPWPDIHYYKRKWLTCLSINRLKRLQLAVALTVTVRPNIINTGQTGNTVSCGNPFLPLSYDFFGWYLLNHV